LTVVPGIKSERATRVFSQSGCHDPDGPHGETEEIANVVAFTASPAASYVTGANLVVGGAFTRRV
jgi:NAD(P)-dependent dehydrogenase (short-subunit alcohol dehydrogenase family)